MTIESAQQRAAKLAAAAQSLKRRSGRADAAFCLAFMTDGARAPHPERIVEALPKGSAIVLRDYDDPRRRARAANLKEICAERAVLLIVAGDAGLAEEIGADGVHIPSWMDAAAEIPSGMIKTVSCHGAADLARAAKASADIAFLAPAFATASHPDAPALGAERFRALARDARLPVIALGGVDETNAAGLAGPNVAGLGSIGAFLESA